VTCSTGSRSIRAITGLSQLTWREFPSAESAARSRAALRAQPSSQSMRKSAPGSSTATRW
jgi:hypothetical protein